MSTDLETAPKDPELGGPEQIQTAWRRLAGGAETAAKTLIDIAQNGSSELARVQASQAILNRVGLQTSSDLNIRVVPAEFDPIGPKDSNISPSAIIRNRLAELRAGMLNDMEPEPDEDGVIDAELVEE